MENAPYPSSTNEWEEFVGELDIDEITARAAHSKPQWGISTNHLIKVWCINMESDQKTLNMTTQRELRTDNPKLTRKFGTVYRILRYKRIRKNLIDTLFATKKYVNHHEVTHAAKYLLPIRVLFMLFLCSQRGVYYRQFKKNPRRLMHQRQYFVICLVIKPLTIWSNSADKLLQPWGSWRREHLGQIRLNYRSFLKRRQS